MSRLIAPGVLSLFNPGAQRKGIVYLIVAAPRSFSALAGERDAETLDRSRFRA
jgi:hypothetical protein